MTDDSAREPGALPAGGQPAARRLRLPGLALPPAVAARVAAVRAARGRVWLVGGAVRDALVERATRDFDFATDLAPPRLFAVFPDAPTRDLGLGAVRWSQDGDDVAFTSLREEGDYRDRRHPGWVRFVAEPAVDALRRDFTVNALYAEVGGTADETLPVLDPTGGLADLRAGVLRAIGEPHARLREDPLRILRGLRLAAQHRLRIDPPTYAAMQELAGELGTLSGERVLAELTGAFSGPGRGRALRLLVDAGAAAVVLPELLALDGLPHPPEFHPEGDVLTHVTLVLAHVRGGDPVQGWTAVLHDSGKPATFERAGDRIRFSRHDVVSAELADAVLRRLRAPNDLREAVVEITRDHIRFATLPAMARAKCERWLRAPLFAGHLQFHRADCLGSHGKLDIHAWAAAELARLPPLPPPPLVSGRDVVALGIAPGPRVGELLRAVQEALDGGAATDRTGALAILARLARPHLNSPSGSADKPAGESG
jgi:poly(A) polymerase